MRCRWRRDCERLGKLAGAGGLVGYGRPGGPRCSPRSLAAGAGVGVVAASACAPLLDRPADEERAPARASPGRETTPVNVEVVPAPPASSWEHRSWEHRMR